MHRYSRRAAVLAAAVVLTVACALAGARPLTAQDNIGRGRITGQVIDETGQPLAGAKIVVQIVDGTTRLEGTSDKKGRFAVAGMGTGRWRVTATLKGYVDSFIEMSISQVRPNPGVTLTLQNAGGRGFQADPESLAALDRAAALEKEGRLDEALAELEGFLRKYPDIFQVRTNLGAIRLEKGDLAGAEADFRAVLEATGGTAGQLPKDKASAARALTGLGELALKKDDLDTAVKSFSDALALSPDDEAAAYNVGEILFSNQKLDEAVGYFELAIRINKDWSRPYHKLGFVHLNKGEYDKALEFFRKFLEIDPGSPEAPAVKNVMEAIAKMKQSGEPR
ncbi:MAG TPA: tetratricopeptide repeat protein [Candidatus Aminicenantes bacterium]|nr:tetratricopeptide repeat protein [Candidatus Aminicenantes bacterium]HRY66038.1 tetratricopeptide repeat protein [Candidatus Aminicenantes bacterium]HRZ72913.1 tetratricopeptide repeat protein [Candidatus Aminicenantes bacterium]